MALFTGCASDAFFPETNRATAAVLQKNGCEVWVPRTQVCCGALHYHAAHEDPAKALAEQNCAAFLPDSAEVDAIIVNAAGCGAMLKDYGHLLHNSPQQERATAFARKVKDISEFLVELAPIAPQHPLNLKATYHDACHLCHGQQIRKPPRQLLEMIPGLQLLPLAESEICCGAAGSYNLTQPEMAERLGRRKAQHILATGADAVFSANVGCLIQIGRYLRRRSAACGSGIRSMRYGRATAARGSDVSFGRRYHAADNDSPCSSPTAIPCTMPVAALRFWYTEHNPPKFSGRLQSESLPPMDNSPSSALP